MNPVIIGQLQQDDRLRMLFEWHNCYLQKGLCLVLTVPVTTVLLHPDDHFRMLFEWHNCYQQKGLHAGPVTTVLLQHFCQIGMRIG